MGNAAFYGGNSPYKVGIQRKKYVHTINVSVEMKESRMKVERQASTICHARW